MAVALAAVVTLSTSVPVRGADTDSANKPKPIPVGDVQRSTPVDFEKEILPVLSSSCLACHNKTKAKAKLILETPADIRKGGESGPAAVAGKGGESLLIKAAAHAPEIESPMPPPHNAANAPDLTSAQLGLIRLWIDQGANGEVHGSSAPVAWGPIAPGLDPIYAVAVSGDGQFAACGRGNRIDVYHLPTNRLVAHLADPQLSAGAPGAAHRDMVESLAFSPDGMLLASGSYREIKLWRRPTPLKKYGIAGLGAKSTCAAASPDGRLIAVGDADGQIRLFDAAAGAAAGELKGHEGPITGVCFSADGSRLASTSTDKSIRVWDVAAKTLFCKTEAPVDLRAVAWVAAGKQVAAGGDDGGIRRYKLPEAADGEMAAAKELKGHDGPVNALEAVPSADTQLLSGGEDGTVRLWNIDAAQPVRQVKHGSAVTSVAVRNDGKRFASAGLDNTIKLWNFDDGKPLAAMTGDPALQNLATSADRALARAVAEVAYCKARIGEAEKDAKSQAERLQKGKDALATVVKETEGKQRALDATKAARDAVDKEMAAAKKAAEDRVASAEEELKRLKAAADADETREKEKANAEKADAEKAKAEKANTDKTGDDKTGEDKAKEDKASEEKAKAEKATADKAIAEKKANTQKEIAKAMEAVKKAREAAAAPVPDERKKSAEKEIAKAEEELKKAAAAKAGAEQEVTSATASADASTRSLARATEALASAEADRTRREADVPTAKKAYAESQKPVRAIAFSPDGLLLAGAGDDGIVHLFSGDKGLTGEVLGDRKSPLGAVLFTGPTALVALGPSDGTASAWDIAGPWKLERTLGTCDGPSPIADRVISLDFSPDGLRLASGGGVPSRGGEVRIWELSVAKMEHAFDEIDTDAVTCLRYSPDGRRLACASADRFVRVIDPASGKVDLSLEGHQHHVLGVAWKSDGHLLATAGADNTLRFWSADTGERKKVVTGFDKEVTGVAFLGDTDLAVATSGDGKVKSYHDSGADGRTFPGASDFVYAAAATSDGGIIVAGGQDGILRAWDANTGQPTATLPPEGR
ncbi:MAG TPA: c-type cytochrome domain-containing protein [Tepidisphaeraceae bacterium]|nr:c-type cytochrome domain-containing protein [Tepidisphaeraceae bacterium]